MGTKNNPGRFDCYANAEPDEPIFILLGRDRDAAILVALWAELRARRGEDEERVTEAQNCAASMWQYLGAHRGRRMTGAGDVLAVMTSDFVNEWTPD